MNTLAQIRSIGIFVVLLGINIAGVSCIPLRPPTKPSQIAKSQRLNSKLRGLISEAERKYIQSDYEGALKSISSIKQNPKAGKRTRFLAYHLEGLVHSARGDLKAAELAFENALKKPVLPKYTLAILHMWLSELYMINRQPRKSDESAQLAYRLAEGRGLFSLSLSKAAELYKAGRLNEVIGYCQGVEEVPVGRFKAFLRLVQASYIRKKDSSEAEEIAETIERAVQRERPPSDVNVPIVRWEPFYPKNAVKLDVTGWVEVGYDISPAGLVTNARVLESKPPNIFDESALNSVKSWIYLPTNKMNKDVKVKLTFDFGDPKQ